MAADHRLRRLGQVSGFSRRDLVRLQRLDLIAMPEGEPSELLLRRLRRIGRLRRDLGLELEAAAVVLRLLDQIEASGRPVAARRWAVRVVDAGSSDPGGRH
jgi:hypothetical protein